MSQDSTETAAETTFGIDTKKINEQCIEQCNEADSVYSAVVDAGRAKLVAAHDAVSALLNSSAAANDINSLLTTLSAKERRQQRASAQQARTAMIEAAKKTRHEALKADPFTHRANTLVRRQYGDEYANALLEHAPFTFASLRKLARVEGWCADFEGAMEGFVRAMALPDEKRTVTRSIPWSRVPHSYSPQAGETWVAHLTIPAYVRDVSRHNDEYTFDDLRSYATEITYEKTDEKTG